MAKKTGSSVFGRIQKFLGKGQLQGAIQEVEEALKKDPSDMRLLHKLGDLYAKDNQIPLAVDAYTRVAETYVERSFFQRAVAVFKQVLKLDPTRLDIQMRLADVYVELDRKADAITLYQPLAHHYEAQGNLAQTIDIYRAIVELDTSNVPSRVKLAELHYSIQDEPAAIDEFVRALGQIEATNNWSDYIKVAERLLYIDENHLPTLRGLASIYLEQGETMQAIARLQNAFKIDRSDPRTLSLLAEAFQALGQIPKTLSILHKLVGVLENQEESYALQETYERIVALDPEDAKSQHRLQELRAASPETSDSMELPTNSENQKLDNAPAFVDGATSPPPPPEPTPSAPPSPAALEDEEPIEELLSEAEVYLKYGLAHRVQETLDNVFRREPGNINARRLQIELLKSQENDEEALQNTIQLARDIGPSNEATQLLEPLVEQEGLSAERQEEIYQLLIQLSPSDPPTATPPHTTQAPDEEASVSLEEIEEIDFEEVIEFEEMDDASSQEDLQEIASFDGLDSMEDIEMIEEEIEIFEEIPIDDEIEEEIEVEELPTSLAPGLPTIPTPPPTAHPYPTTSISNAPLTPTPTTAPAATIPKPLRPSYSLPTTPNLPRSQAPATPISFAPPSNKREIPEDELFSRFKENTAEEDDEAAQYTGEFKDFLSQPFQLDADEAKPSDDVPPTGMNAMEAAAARLEALIRAKEEESQEISVEELPAAADTSNEMVSTANEKSVELPPPPSPFLPPAPFGASQIATELPIQEEELTPPPPTNAPSTAHSSTIPSSWTTPAEELVEAAQEENFTAPSGVPALQDLDLATEEHTLAEEHTLDVRPNQRPSGTSNNEFNFEATDGLFESLEESTGSFESIDAELEDLVLEEFSPHFEELEEAELYMEQEEFGYALEIYEQILRESPDNEFAQQGRTLAQVGLETQQEQAKQSPGIQIDLDTALGIGAPTQARARDRIVEEIQQFQEAVKQSIGEEEGETHFELGIAYHGMGLFSQAIDAFETCQRGHYREVDCSKMIGTCHLAQGKVQDALQSFQSALALPNLQPTERLDILFEIGQAFEQSGDWHQALAYYQEVTQIETNYRGVLSRLQRLQAG